MPSKGALAALFFVAGLVFLALSPSRSVAGQIFAREQLVIVTADGKSHQFNTELALNEAQREQGLMFRRVMGENEAMLFDFGEPRLVTMWMKNTLLPLDMLFMDEAGRITHMHRNAVPLSQTIIPSGEPVRYVLELSAGTIDRLSIAEKDLVKSRQIGNAAD